MANSQVEIKKGPGITLDELPLGKFHWRVFAGCSGCPFLDGYVLGIIAISLSIMSTQISMSLTMSGLIGMAVLGGMFVGSLFGGYITDIIGRKKMFFSIFFLLRLYRSFNFLLLTRCRYSFCVFF